MNHLCHYNFILTANHNDNENIFFFCAVTNKITASCTEIDSWCSQNLNLTKDEKLISKKKSLITFYLNEKIWRNHRVIPFLLVVLSTSISRYEKKYLCSVRTDSIDCKIHSARENDFNRRTTPSFIILV